MRDRSVISIGRYPGIGIIHIRIKRVVYTWSQGQRISLGVRIHSLISEKLYFLSIRCGRRIPSTLRDTSPASKTCVLYLAKGQWWHIHIRAFQRRLCFPFYSRLAAARSDCTCHSAMLSVCPVVRGTTFELWVK